MKSTIFTLRLFVFFFGMLLVFTSCGKKKEDVVVQGMAPIYINPEDASLIYSEGPQAYENLGLPVKYGNFLFINEHLKGIHVIDNTDPANPVKKYFWHIPGNTRFTIYGDVLYADNSVHLWTIDISDYSDIKVLKINKDVYKQDDVYRPENGYKGPFECVEIEKGALVGWEMKELTNPKCTAI